MNMSPAERKQMSPEFISLLCVKKHQLMMLRLLRVSLCKFSTQLYFWPYIVFSWHWESWGAYSQFLRKRGFQTSNNIVNWDFSYVIANFWSVLDLLSIKLQLFSQLVQIDLNYHNLFSPLSILLCILNRFNYWAWKLKLNKGKIKKENLVAWQEEGKKEKCHLWFENWLVLLQNVFAMFQWLLHLTDEEKEKGTWGWEEE